MAITFSDSQKGVTHVRRELYLDSTTLRRNVRRCLQRTDAADVTLEATSAAHATRIAGGLATLVTNQDPQASLVLDTHVPERAPPASDDH
jgi:hypothetical protein